MAILAVLQALQNGWSERLPWTVAAPWCLLFVLKEPVKVFAQLPLTHMFLRYQWLHRLYKQDPITPGSAVKGSLEVIHPFLLSLLFLPCYIYHFHQRQKRVQPG